MYDIWISISPHPSPSRNEPLNLATRPTTTTETQRTQDPHLGLLSVSSSLSCPLGAIVHPRPEKPSASYGQYIYVLPDYTSEPQATRPSWGEARWMKPPLRGYAKQGERRLDHPAGNCLRCLVSNSPAGRLREASRDGCKNKQGQLGAKRPEWRTGRKRQWRTGRGREQEVGGPGSRLQFGTRADVLRHSIFWGQGARKTGSHVGPWSCVLFARLSTWGVRFAEEVGRGQVASIRLGATGQRVEFGVQRSPAQTESAGVSVCSVQESASSKRWLMGVHFRGGRPMSRSDTLLRCHWEPYPETTVGSPSLSIGADIWQENYHYESRN